MQPPAKKRKFDSPATTAHAVGGATDRADVVRKEIPESPQDSPGAAQYGSSPKLIFNQRPRFALLSKEDDEPISDDLFGQTRFTQRPRPASSALDIEEQNVAPSAKSTPRVASRRKRPRSPVSDAQSEAALHKAKNKDRSGRRKNDQLIGMALHQAPGHCLGIEEIYEWIIDNFPDHDLEDLHWRDGIWVTLTVSRDFMRRDGNSKAPWTFRDGASTKYRPRDHSISHALAADASTHDVNKNYGRSKQGRGVETLASNHNLLDDDFKLPEKSLGRTSTKRFSRAASETNSTLPSTIDETIDIIDLTMDEDEPLRPTTKESPRKPPTAPNFISLLGETSEGNSENNQRPGLVGFGEPIWKKTTSPIPTRQSLTPFTDRILENASKETIERFSGTEKWKAANKHINNLLGSSPKAIRSTDAETTESMNPSGLASLDSQPLELVVVPSREDYDYGSNLKEKSLEPGLLDTDVMRVAELPQPAPSDTEISEPPDSTEIIEQPDPIKAIEQPDSTEILEQSNASDHRSKKLGPVPSDHVIPMDLDPPEQFLEPKAADLAVPESAQASNETTNHIEPRPTTCPEETSLEEQLLQKLASQERLPPEALLEGRTPQEPLHEEGLTEEPHAEEQHINTYADSAVQTDLPAASVFAIGTITQIDLEPQAPMQVSHTAVCEIVDSTTQTENPPAPQAAPDARKRLPRVQPTKAQKKTTDPSLQKTSKRPVTRAQFEKCALALLDTYMYKETSLVWPDHLKGPPQENPDPLSFDHEAKMKEIRARPTRKQIFGKVALSRVAGNDALTRLNGIKLGKQRAGEVDIYKGHTDEQMEEQKKLNAQEGYYSTMEELLNLPQQVVPHIYEQQLAFRDYAPVSRCERA
ncbi:unnamed protein product [Aureobasidium vineae]|uniref:Fork-head domain-containing protein n=1 Tax=Aureobasidium vineae TaxID=2773715 RepID=A0A9N8JJY1_9PEZI|nr:unnamed protein product [Aureobasidium vineae]